MDTVVHDTGSAKDQKEYIRDNTQAQLVIQGAFPFPHLQKFEAEMAQWEASIEDLTEQFAAVPFWRSTPKLKPTKPQFGMSMVPQTRKLFGTQSRESRRSRRQFTCSRSCLFADHLHLTSIIVSSVDWVQACGLEHEKYFCHITRLWVVLSLR